MYDLPTLAFVPVDQLLIHERHDSQRTRPLVIRIRNSGVWRNPPIVSPLRDGSGRYMVLDGANRTTALQMMEFPHALVQVVEPDDPGLELQTWNHVIWEMNARRFLQGLRDISRIFLQVAGDSGSEPSISGTCALVVVRSCKGRTYDVCCEPDDKETRVDVLNAIVDSYKEKGRLDRTNVRSVKTLGEIYPQFSGLVIFPEFEVNDVMALAGKGCLLPSGITRFTISPRALHINYPLEKLEEDRPLEKKNEELKQWIKERIARKAVRYYAEPTVLFDE